MKNSAIDCVWAMENAEAMVPNRLAAPPKTTTRKVSTMYSEPEVGPVEPMVVNAAPATPATPQPRAKVMRSTFFVLMPTERAITRFCTVARTCRPQRERYSRKKMASVSSSVTAITNRPLRGMSMASVGLNEPISQSGMLALTSRAPKIERNACCITSDSPQVANSVSSGRW